MNSDLFNRLSLLVWGVVFSTLLMSNHSSAQRPVFSGQQPSQSQNYRQPASPINSGFIETSATTRQTASSPLQPVFQQPNLNRAITNRTGTGIVPLSELPTRKFSPEELTNISVYDKVSRSVVNIDTKARRQLRMFGGPQQDEGSGTGWVLDKQGHIVTNFHVISGSDVITVTLSEDKDPYPAQIVGSDPQNDIALIKIEAPADLLYPVRVG